MERIVNIAKNQEEARQWDIKQAVSMTHEERQKVSLKLKKRVFGDQPDLKEWRKQLANES